MHPTVRALVVSLTCLVLAGPAAAAPAGDLKTVTTLQLKAVKDYAKQRFAACSAEIGGSHSSRLPTAWKRPRPRPAPASRTS